jgi:hypothetical protein
VSQVEKFSILFLSKNSFDSNTAENQSGNVQRRWESHHHGASVRKLRRSSPIDFQYELISLIVCNRLKETPVYIERNIAAPFSPPAKLQDWSTSDTKNQDASW